MLYQETLPITRGPGRDAVTGVAHGRCIAYRLCDTSVCALTRVHASARVRYLVHARARSRRHAAENSKRWRKDGNFKPNVMMADKSI